MKFVREHRKGDDKIMPGKKTKPVEKYTFSVLLDGENKGIIVAHNIELNHNFRVLNGKWERTGIWSDYMFAGIFPESPKDEDDYRRVDINEAKELLGEHFFTLP